MRVSRVVPAEYDALQRYLEDAYGLPHRLFPRAYSQSWRKENTDFGNMLAIRERGTIVSFVRIFPMRLHCGSAAFTAGGIGGVSTLPAHRGRGMMTMLMDTALRKMKRDGHTISVLWGDRHRYRNFGYENAGTTFDLTVTPRSLSKAGVAAAEARRWPGDRETLKAIHALYRANPFHKERAIEETRRCLLKSDLTVYSAGEGRNFAYAAIGGHRGQLAEFGGPARGILRILGHLERRFGIGPTTLPFPGRSFAPPALFEAAHAWNIRTGQMLRILDPIGLLRAYRREIEPLFPDDGELSFGLTGETGVLLRKKKGRLAIGPTSSPALALSATEAARLVFGPCFEPTAGADAETRALIRAVFPVPFFVWPTDHC